MMADEERGQLTEAVKRELLGVARKVIEATVRGDAVPEFESSEGVLNERRGCFVTIHNRGRLRGCIGQFQAEGPLLETVREMAIAATRDGRFVTDPLRRGELEQIDIEISVLSPLERTADPLSLRLGRDGIYIKRGWASGCFLPQVATETGWSKEEFLSQCCGGKAGLPSDAWQDPQTEVYLFTAEVFGEAQLGRR